LKYNTSSTVFEKKSRSRISGGTGLGLAIAKQLIEAQGGTIEAKNLDAGGLQVQIKFFSPVDLRENHAATFTKVQLNPLAG
jgi:K+-sensing histidine kinase KdpD